MIKYDFLDVGLSYRPKRKFGGELLIPAAVVGGASLVSSIVGASSARSNNQASMQFTADANQKQMDFAREMYEKQLGDAIAAEGRANVEFDRRQQMSIDAMKEMQAWIQNNYQSPSAQVRALRAAGLNPAMILGGSHGFGSVSSSVPSPSAPSVNYPSPTGVSLHGAPALENEGVVLGEGIESLSRSVANVVSADKTSEETRRLRDTHDIFVQTAMAEKLTRQTAAEHMQLQLSLDKLNLPKKQDLEIKKMYADFSNATLFGELTQAQAIYTDMQTKISGLLGKKYSVELDFFRQSLELHMQHVSADIALKKAQEKAALGSASQSYASARNLDAQTKTEDAIRQWKVDLERMNSLIAKSDNTIKQASVQAEIEVLANRAVASGLANKETQERIQVLIKEKNWYELNKLLNGLGAGAVVGALVK